MIFPRLAGGFQDLQVNILKVHSQKINAKVCASSVRTMPLFCGFCVCMWESLQLFIQRIKWSGILSFQII